MRTFRAIGRMRAGNVYHLGSWREIINSGVPEGRTDFDHRNLGNVPGMQSGGDAPEEKKGSKILKNQGGLQKRCVTRQKRNVRERPE